VKKIFNFSGGRTSAMMVAENYQQGDLVIFCDTGREHPNTYKFINDFEAFENIPVIYLKYEGGFENLIAKKKIVPNIMMRFCTIELKIKTVRRYLRSIGLTKYQNIIGFRYDEQRRIANYKEHWKTVSTSFPLNDAKVSKQDVLNYWANKSYNLETPAILGNCDLCFLKGKNAIIQILREQPDLAAKWIADEKSVNGTYIKGISYEKMLQISKQPFFKQQNLFDLEPAFNCACTA
jgi:hypothetical protein